MATINLSFFDDYYIEYYIILVTIYCARALFVELSAYMASRLVHEIEVLFLAIYI